VTTTGPRVIGLLGGMSWESSAEYYRLANELVRDRLGGLHSAQLVLALVDFADIERLLAHVQSRYLAAASGVPDGGQADGRDVQASLHVVHALGRDRRHANRLRHADDDSQPLRGWRRTQERCHPDR